MKLIKTTLIALTVSVAGFSASATADINWDYIEGGYVHNEISDTNIDQDGFSLGYSASIKNDFFSRANYDFVSGDVSGVDIDFSLLNAGFGYKKSIDRKTDVFALASLENIDVEGNSGSIDGTGYSAGAGTRFQLTDSLELNGELGYIKIKDLDISDLYYTVGLTYEHSHQYSFAFEFRAFEDVNFTSMSFRYAY